jgi:tripartite-type tricarboxylate transporter receptor subunit TctC
MGRATRRALGALGPWLATAAAAAGGAAPARRARAQAAGAEAWPTRPIRIVVPYAPGGSSDVLARLVAPRLQATLGQPVVIDNRPGAGSLIGAEHVARSAPDGYTLLLADTPHAILPAVMERLPFDALADFAPVSLLGVAPMLLFAHPALPARDAAEFVALARAAPDCVAVASAGNGTSSHLTLERFRRLAGVRLIHVPYRGAGPALADLAAGQVQAAFGTVASAAPLLQNGAARVLGVAAESRLPELPQAPTLRESGVDLVVTSWFGVLAPSALPAGVLARLAPAVAEAAGAPGLAPRFAQLNVTPRADGPTAFAALLREEVARWGEVARAAGVRVQ